MTIENINTLHNSIDRTIIYFLEMGEDGTEYTSVLKFYGTRLEFESYVSSNWEAESDHKIHILFDREPTGKEIDEFVAHEVDANMNPHLLAMTEEDEEEVQKCLETERGIKVSENPPTLFEIQKEVIHGILNDAWDDLESSVSSADDASNNADHAEDCASDARDYIQEAKDSLDYADSKADEACDYAKDARNYADEARNYADDAQDKIKQARKKLQDLEDTNTEMRKALIHMANSYCMLLTNLRIRFGIKAEGTDYDEFRQVYALQEVTE